MWIICGGKVSHSLAKLVSEKTGLTVQGAELKDVLVTYKVRGKDYFKGVKGFIVLDSGLDTLVDLNPLNDLLSINKNIHFINRFTDTINENRVNEKISVHNVKEIYLTELQAIMMKGSVNNG